MRQKASGIFCNVLRENNKRNAEIQVKTERCVEVLIKTERYVVQLVKTKRYVAILSKTNTVEQQAKVK